nr:hypothetical protein DOP62_06340 [Synechococcus elongatus PCC 11801]
MPEQQSSMAIHTQVRTKCFCADRLNGKKSVHGEMELHCNQPVLTVTVKLDGFFNMVLLSQ